MPVETAWWSAVEFGCYRLKDALAPGVEIVQFKGEIFVEQAGMPRIVRDLSLHESDIVCQALQAFQFDSDIGSNAAQTFRRKRLHRLYIYSVFQNAISNMRIQCFERFQINGKSSEFAGFCQCRKVIGGREIGNRQIDVRLGGETIGH